MQRFQLVRSEDVSGSSGTGTVAEGVVFSDGAVAMRWPVKPISTGFFGCSGDVERIHGHEGCTVVQVLDVAVP
ncbi:hypothetical protein [Deinococcus apachensis]|uniref:hypothetical protein n=1 Tax=Deinococcus apachensis TaxID=309886 RepID=UPI00035FBFD5|nr:hypothetical protein [Deinococcus apachensis]